jgi:hypothetical protein
MDIVDNHIYSSPEQMRDVTNTYDTWDRARKPKVFVGEYANNICKSKKKRGSSRQAQAASHWEQ